MPLVRIALNSSVSEQIRGSALRLLSKRVSEILGKPEKYVQVLLEVPESMLFGGSDEPSAFIQIKSIGSLEPDRVKELSRELGSLVHREFDIPPDRLYIEFSDIKPSMWGWNSTPFG